MKTSNYTMPRLCGDDISKDDWYVYFYFTDPATQEKKMFRYKKGINKIKSKRERKSKASALISALTYKLNSGWNPITGALVKKESDELTVVTAMRKLFDIKKSYLTEASIRTYNNQINLFTRWIEREELDHLYTSNFTNRHFRMYCDYLLGERKYSGKTFNTHLVSMRTFFNDMVSRGYMQESPAKDISTVREEVGKNTIYGKTEEKLFDKIKNKEPEFYLATRFVKYCFLRRTELAKMQVKHINWENKTIVIPSNNSKTRVQDSITIPMTLEKMIVDAGFLDLDRETFLFGRNFKPSIEELKRLDDFSDMQRKINDQLGIKRESTFYSWKHTGAVELFNLTKDPYVVMRQCRHTDIKMTMVYLRSLGCGVNEQVRQW